MRFFTLCFAILFFITAGAIAKDRTKYWPVTVATLSTTAHTHVMLTSTIVFINHSENDGDTHLRLQDGTGPFIVAECIPELPCPAVKVGQKIRVRGISRFDKQHKWYEIHPVELLELNF